MQHCDPAHVYLLQMMAKSVILTTVKRHSVLKTVVLNAKLVITYLEHTVIGAKNIVRNVQDLPLAQNASGADTELSVSTHATFCVLIV